MECNQYLERVSYKNQKSSLNLSSIEYSFKVCTNLLLQELYVSVQELEVWGFYLNINLLVFVYKQNTLLDISII